VDSGYVSDGDWGFLPVHETNRTAHAQVDQLKGWFLEKPIPYISNDNFRQDVAFDYWNDHQSGRAHVK
jgi:hypothetical protein